MKTRPGKIITLLFSWIGATAILVAVASWLLGGPLQFQVAAAKGPPTCIVVCNSALSRTPKLDTSFADVVAKIPRSIVIQQANRQDVDNAVETASVSQKVKDKQALLWVYSHGSNHFLVVKERKSK